MQFRKVGGASEKAPREPRHSVQPVPLSSVWLQAALASVTEFLLRPNQIAFGAVRAFVSLWVQSQSGCCSVWRSGIVSHIGPTCTFVRCPFALIFVASAFDADLSW